MHVIYGSCLCEKNFFYKKYSIQNMPGQQVQKYHRLIVEGMAANNTEIDLISAPPVIKGRFIKGNKTVIDSKLCYHHLPVLKVPLLGGFLLMCLSFLKTIIISRKKKSKAIICDALHTSISLGTQKAARLLKIPSIGIITDLPEFLYQNADLSRVKRDTKVINSFDSYVFLTEEMKNKIDCQGKSYVVIEGQVDKEMKNMDNEKGKKDEKKICIYAGGLCREYGIPELVEGFIRANIENAELHLYGNGDFEEELEKTCKAHENIKFFGVRTNDEVVEKQLQATLLINPRPSNREFTKYSFPSKNMEYMVSGTPVLTTKLPGMPKEYYPYVFLIEEETADGIANTLKDILAKPKDELWEFGAKAKAWVLREKNNAVQSRKILEMMERM